MTVPVRYVTIRKFAEETGYTENAIRSKISEGVWLEGQVWVKAPDGRNLIDVEGYNAWVTNGSSRAFLPVGSHRSPLPLSKEENNTKSRRNFSPPPLGPQK